ncbi:MAG TPA: SNF2-related protein [Acetobacteraceae bacterium]|jgi:superfamily II DNA or RNA helicase
MPTPFSSEDLGRVFDARALTRGRTLVLFGAVGVALNGDVISATVEHLGERHTAVITPGVLVGRRVTFDSHCSCRQPNCTHLAATALAALDRFPALRKAEPQKNFLGALATPVQEARRVVFDLAVGDESHACFVAALLVGQRTGRMEATTPRRILADPASGAPARAIARLIGGGDDARTGVPAELLPDVLSQLVTSGLGRWPAGARRLIAGTDRVFEAGTQPKLPPKSAILVGSSGPWYVDAATGAVGRARFRKPAPPPPPAPVRRRAVRAEPARVAAPVAERVIVEQPPTPVLRLRKLQCPDDYGRLSMIDALTLDFDYGGVAIDGDDERQFVRMDGPGGPSFARRDLAAEMAAMESLQADGLVQVRVADGKSAKGRRVLMFRSDDAAERWHRFVAGRVPALEVQGWRSMIEPNFGPRLVKAVGGFDVQVADAERGSFSLDFGIEIEGVRHPLLPILTHLLERGGIDAAQIVGDELITSLEDGRVVKLPAERIQRLLAIMGDLIEATERNANDDKLVLPDTDAFSVLELEELLATRVQDASAIQAYVDRFRDNPVIEPVTPPAGFTITLRPYQQQGLAWLQHLRVHGMGAFLADDMGLGKTAQTIAHIAVEHAAGRLDRPALVVVPTSLISNWTAELAKFAPGLSVVVLHGLDRHERREQLGDVDVAVTTYTVLTRDIEEMKRLSWHIVVLDETQAIKSPDAKATRAVCQLDTRHRVCLSGTPIENNLDDLWSQFAFLMPGLLGDRKGFAKRFRAPIEKKADETRRLALVRRIRPFIMRRTKSEVATELPPKHTVLRRITLAPEQRELYETIRATLYDRVREQVAEMSLARSRIVVLDALLKLRQACCDPRLVKLPSARQVGTSSKLDDLMEMIGEMIPEGRRILLFSQFTSMLDLIKPRLVADGIPFTELRGDTRDRGEKVREFESGEVPLFLISLKAGGRGLNLTSADTVIHYDPWWNPAVEDQASDRAHRIGQTKSVFVYKMIAADTVEERILELQQRKAELANIAFDEVGELAELDFGDIDYLFGVNAEKKAA